MTAPRRYSFPRVAEASGRAFLGLIRYIKDEYGADALQSVIAAGGPTVAPVFAQPIRIMAWYPYTAFGGFLRAIERGVGGGDAGFCRRLGAVAGTRDLGTIFRIYRALASPERLIRACDKVWPSYYRGAGRMEAVTWSPDDTTLRIYDFPDMVPSHCRLMEGWMVSTMRNIGVRVGDDAMETACVARGATYHEFRCSWRKGG